MSNQLTKLKRILNPKPVTFSGEVVGVLDVRTYMVRPTGGSAGDVRCTSARQLSAGDRVYVEGTTVKESGPKGRLIFIEV